MRRPRFLPDLPRRAWVLLAGDCISFFGNGLILPFTIIYLTRARGIPIEIAGFALAVRSVVGLFVGPVAGTLVDRIGARRVLIFAQVTTAVATVSFIFVHEPWQAFLASALNGIGWSSFWPSMQSMLSTVVDPSQRSPMFAVHYASLNLGIGIGGIIGGVVANISDPASFERLFAIDALTFLPVIAILLLAPSLAGAGRATDIDQAPATEADEVGPSGYLQVLKDRVFVRVVILMVVLTTVGYSQLESSFPAFATGEGGISTAMLGLAFAGNTFFIVIAQLLVLRRIEGVRRTRAITVLCGAWALCWAATIAAGVVDGTAAAVGFISAMVLFAFGETLLSPTIPAIVNDLAPERLRGRYNALYSFAWNGGTFFGPALAGLFLGAELALPFFAGLVVACGLAGAYSLRLERHLPPGTNQIQAEAAGG
ncbi:MAG TPA: MFS transporter [Actinomycetota bacterium]|nr:MFS transporter [Actinomycetota bacterium]